MTDTDLRWTYGSLDTLTAAEVYAILELRNAVFVVEQECPYLDIDGADRTCWHVCGWRGDELMAYSRVLAPGATFAEASLGRVATSASGRGQGLGRELLRRTLDHMAEQFPGQPVRIGAQTYLVPFYESFGFTIAGEAYLEDGIPHIEMLLAAP